jgi:predicted branched-subunit amino acid permease
MPPFLRGLIDALLLPAWVVGIALIGVGSLARDVGYPMGVAVLSTLLVWAGPAQVLFFGAIAAGAAWSAIALAVGFSSLRFLPMTVSLLPLLRRPGQGTLMQMFLAHFVAVTVWTEGLRRLPAMPVEQRVGYYLGFGLACIGLSCLGTALGYLLVGQVPKPVAAALLFMSPLFFLLSLVAGLRRMPDAVAVVLGFALTPVATYLIPGGFDLIVAGLIAGTVAFGLGRRRRPA